MFVPAIEGLEEAGYWTPREAVSAREVPKHLIVLGAGAVGTEMATAYRELGGEVTLIATGRVLSKAVEEASRRVEEGLKKSRINVRISPYTKSVKREGGQVIVWLVDGTAVVGSELLIATGRGPGRSALDWTQSARLVEGRGSMLMNPCVSGL